MSDRLTLSEYQAIKAVPEPSKLNNVKTEAFGRTFASKWEAECYRDLMLREKAGEISNLRCQVRIPLVAALVSEPGKVEAVPVTFAGKRTAVYYADFGYDEAGEATLAEAKGAWTAIGKLKVQWARAQGHTVVIMKRGKR